MEAHRPLVDITTTIVLLDCSRSFQEDTSHVLLHPSVAYRSLVCRIARLDGATVTSPKLTGGRLGTSVLDL